MKRCPQCEFIYEDDQRLCDMDGVLLVLDSRNLPNLHALATVSAPVPEKGPRRRAMVPAFATLILMLAVASVYYMSTMRTAAPPDFSPASVTGGERPGGRATRGQTPWYVFCAHSRPRVTTASTTSAARSTRNSNSLRSAAEKSDST